PGDALGAALAEFASAPHVAEKIGRARPGLGIEEPRQRVHDVLGGHFAAVVEAHALPERERPREPVTRRPPELGERRCHGQRLVCNFERLRGKDETALAPRTPRRRRYQSPGRTESNPTSRTRSPEPPAGTTRSPREPPRPSS